MAQPESAPEEVSPPKIDRGWCCRFLSEGPAWELNSQHGLESSVYFENPGHQVSAGQLVLFFAPSRELIGSGDVTSAAAPNNVLPSTSENPVSGVKFRQDIVVGKVTLLPVPTPGFEDFLSDRSVLGSGTIQEIGFEWVELSKMESTSARLRLSRQQGINAARFAKTPVITYEDPTAPLSASTKETLAVAAQIALDANAPFVEGEHFVEALLRHPGQPTSDAIAFRELVLQQVGGPASHFATTFPISGFAASQARPATVQVSIGVSAIFSTARSLLAPATPPDRIVAIRHLAVALVNPQTDIGQGSAVLFLRKHRIDPARLQRGLLDHLATKGENNDRPYWNEIRQDLYGRRRASFNADLSQGIDQLGIQRDVDAMAGLIASVELSPPLSIGLFGNWGSGKSFFMQKLREAIAELRSPEKQTTSAFWPNIISIEFNAWHYIDANLWASLMAHIFDQLSRHGHAAKAPLVNKLIDRLGLAKAASKTAEERKLFAATALETAKQKLSTAKTELENGRQALVDVTAKTAWSTVEKAINDPSHPKHAVILEAKKQIAALGGAIDEAKEAGQGIFQKINELVSFQGQLRTLVLRLLRGGSDALPPSSLVKLGVAAVGLAAVAWIFTRFGSEVIGGIVLFIGESATALAGVVAWIRKNMATISTALKPLEAARHMLEDLLRAEEEKKAADTARLTREVEQRMVDFSQAGETAARAQSALVESEKDVIQVMTGQHIVRFIEGRAASGDYLKHLGIVSMVREDFSQLSELIGLHNRYRRPDPKTSPAAKAEDWKNIAEMLKDDPKLLESVKNTGDLGINRIVLFIDDLDRCPSDRVVEVLQAIHLLLAFPLFVVVVGVDSRWVTRALIDTHPTLFGRDKEGRRLPSEEREADPASPNDYLEKIFQIPYRLPEMEQSGTRKLLESLTNADREEEMGRHSGRGLPFAEIPTRAAAELNPLLSRPIPSTKVLPSPSTAEPIASHPVDLSLPVPLGSSALTLTAAERSAMDQLALIVGRSPRATKRFVNTYRLLRAANPPLRQDFAATMLLLACATGTPNFSHWFLARISRGQNSSEPFSWAALTWCDLFLSSEEAARLRLFLQEKSNPLWQALDLYALSKVAERVRQFSFAGHDDEHTQEDLPKPAPVAGLTPA